MQLTGQALAASDYLSCKPLEGSANVPSYDMFKAAAHTYLLSRVNEKTYHSCNGANCRVYEKFIETKEDLERAQNAQARSFEKLVNLKNMEIENVCLQLDTNDPENGLTQYEREVCNHYYGEIVGEANVGKPKISTKAFKMFELAEKLAQKETALKNAEIDKKLAALEKMYKKLRSTITTAVIMVFPVIIAGIALIAGWLTGAMGWALLGMTVAMLAVMILSANRLKDKIDKAEKELIAAQNLFRMDCNYKGNKYGFNKTLSKSELLDKSKFLNVMDYKDQEIEALLNYVNVARQEQTRDLTNENNESKKKMIDIKFTLRGRPVKKELPGGEDFVKKNRGFCGRHSFIWKCC